MSARLPARVQPVRIIALDDLDAPAPLPIYTTERLAELLGVSRDQVTEYVRCGILRAHRLRPGGGRGTRGKEIRPRRYYFLWADVVDALESVF